MKQLYVKHLIIKKVKIETVIYITIYHKKRFIVIDVPSG